MGLRTWLYGKLDRGHAPERDPDSLLQIGRVRSHLVPMALAHLERNGYAAIAQSEQGTGFNRTVFEYSSILIQVRWAIEAAEVLEEFNRDVA